MSRKYILITGALLLSLTFSACAKKENQGNGADAGTISPTSEPLSIPSDIPIITIMPDKHYKAEEGDDAVAHNEAEEGDAAVAHNEAEEEEAAVAALAQEESQMFYYEELTQEIKDRINGKSYGDKCDVPYEELRYVKVLYWGFDNELQDGELIVNKAIAEDIVEIFKELYELKYPIEQMVLVDEYDADDNISMAADNTSAFNYRVVDNGSGRLSKHSYGLAIDINPLYNPYVREVGGETVISPENGAQYADRTLDCRYYVTEGDACYQAFTLRGFTWGGAWKNQKDYQHFEKKLD